MLKFQFILEKLIEINISDILVNISMIDDNDTKIDEIIWIPITLHKIIKNGIYMTENLSNLPEGTSIFTLPITASFNCPINVDHIYNYFPLHKDDVTTIKSSKGMRTLHPKEYAKEYANQWEELYNFMNQITMIMRIFIDETRTETKLVNIKIFNNSSIQVSGLKSMFQGNYTINKLVNLLKGKFVVYLKNDDIESCHFWSHKSKKTTIKFFEDIDDEIWVIDPTISIINITYKYRTKINQSQFYYKVKELKLHKIITENVVVLLQTDINSPVSLWLNSSVNPSKFLTIAIFESGSISIMACKCREDIFYAFNFIINILNTYEDLVSKKSIVPIISNDEEIMKYMDMDAFENVKDHY